MDLLPLKIGNNNFIIRRPINRSLHLLPEGAIAIDSEWRTLNASNYGGSIDSGPWILNEPNAYYYLTEDLSTDNYGFLIGNSGITIDLMGHTLIYNNVDPIEVFNGDFELGNASGWNLSGAPGAEVVVAPEGFPTEYACRFTNQPSGSIWEIISDAIPIPSSEVGKEYIAHATLRGSLFSARSTIEVIDANTSGTIPSPVTLWNENILWTLDNPNTRQNHDRGFSALCQFIPQSGTDAIKIKISYQIFSSPGGDSVLISMVRVRRSRDRGIMPISWFAMPNWFREQYPNMENGIFSSKDNFKLCSTIDGGSVQQGSGRSWHGNAVYYGNKLVTVENCNFSVNGIDTSDLVLEYASGIVVNNCKFNDNMEWNSDRQVNYAAIACGSSIGEIDIVNCSISGQMQCGIYINRGFEVENPARIFISGNTISHNSPWTDGYGIHLASCRNFDILHNTITPINGRGVILHLANISGNIINNYVESKELKNIEYYHAMEATALRMRNYDQRQADILFSGNVWSARTFVGGVHGAIGARVTAQSTSNINDNSNITWVGDTFRATIDSIDPDWIGFFNNGKAWAYTIPIHAPRVGHILRDCRFESNNSSINFGDNDGAGPISGVIFTSPTIVELYNEDPTLYHSLSTYTNLSSIGDTKIIDAIYQSGASQEVEFLSTGPQSIQFGYSLDVQVKNNSDLITGALVTATNSENVVVSGVTTDGICRLDIITLRKSYGIEDTNLNPINIECSYLGMTGSSGIILNEPSGITISIN